MQRQPDKSIQIFLLLMVGFNILPHSLSQPAWLTATAWSCLIWNGLHIFKGVAYPPRWLRHTLALAGAAGVFTEWGTVVGQEPATALLVFLAALKTLESGRYRDAMLIIFTSYFLLMAYLLVNQDLHATLYMAVDVILITSLLFQLHKSDRRSSFRSMRPAMRLLGAALPVWIFLFVLFPRFSTGFWSLKAKVASASGFSDTLDPGSVQRLLQSSDPAFRVSFTNEFRPTSYEMYWRGAVLHKAEGGLRWSRDGYEKLPMQQSIGTASNTGVTQEIYLEPSFRKWLFAFDFPLSIDFEDETKNSQTRERAGNIFETTRDVGSRVVYQAYSSLVFPKQPMTDDVRTAFLQVPEDISPKVIGLASRLRSESDGTAVGVRERILRYLEEEGFVYTKEPGAMQNGTLDEFLFTTKRGFCEHYAGAVATLMRLAGIPSRVVVGFLGGQVNTFGSFVLVRNLDAHAWTEFWNERNEKWTRIDATSVVAPLRARLGAEFFNEGQDQSAFRSSPLYRWQRQFAQAWDAAAMRWNSFLLGYDFDYQQALLQRAGLYAANRWIFFVWATVSIVAFIIMMQVVLRRRAKKEEPLLAAYHALCTKMEKAGVRRAQTEGAATYFGRVRSVLPEKADEFAVLEESFVSLRYGPPLPGAEQKRRLREFKSRVRRLSL